MTENETKLRVALESLLANCDRVRAESRHGQIFWDDRKPGIFYLETGMDHARDILEETKQQEAT